MDVLDQVDALRRKRAEADQKAERILEALLYRAFSGSLTTKWRDAHMKELLAEMELQASAIKERESLS